MLLESGLLEANKQKDAEVMSWLKVRGLYPLSKSSLVKIKGLRVAKKTAKEGPVRTRKSSVGLQLNSKV